MKIKYGFTLIEMVVSMILLGISAISTVYFIGKGTLTYTESVEVVELVEFTNKVITRLDLQISSAIPYQISVAQRDSLSVYSGYELSFIIPYDIVKIVNVNETNNEVTVYSNKNLESYCFEFAILNNDRNLNKVEITKCTKVSNNYYSLILSSSEFINSYIDKAYIVDENSTKTYYVNNKKLVYQYNHSNDHVLNQDVEILSFSINGGEFTEKKHLNDVELNLVTRKNGQSVSISHHFGVKNVP